MALKVLVLEGDELVRQDHSHRNAFDESGKNGFCSRILIHVNHDRGFAIGPA